MSLHVVNAATDADQQTQVESRIYHWRSMTLIQEKTGLPNGSRDTLAYLVIMLGQREIKQMKMK